MRACTAFGMYGPSGTYRAEVHVRVLAQCLACAIGAVHLVCAACAEYLLHVSGVERAHRTCTCKMFGMGRLSGAPIACECACVGMHLVRVHVQGSAWVA